MRASGIRAIRQWMLVSPRVLARLIETPESKLSAWEAGRAHADGVVRRLLEALAELRELDTDPAVVQYWLKTAGPEHTSKLRILHQLVDLRTDELAQASDGGDASGDDE